MDWVTVECLISTRDPTFAVFHRGCQIFLGAIYQNGEEIYRITTNQTKNPCKNPPKFTQISILKIYHLATLFSIQSPPKAATPPDKQSSQLVFLRKNLRKNLQIFKEI
jgi:hypothetical protein